MIFYKLNIVGFFTVIREMGVPVHNLTNSERNLWLNFDLELGDLERFSQDNQQKVVVVMVV